MSCTCKYIHQATTAKPIWTHLFWKCERASPGSLTLEKPLTMYSSKELERVVLSWESSRVGWHTRDGIPSRQRTLHIPNDCLHDIALSGEHYKHYLVPGGRCLLAFRIDGQISYYDLESAEYEKGRILVPGYIEKCGTINDVSFSVDISDRLPFRDFKMAQHVHDDHYHGRWPGYGIIKIWHIDFVFEGHAVVGLRANCLKTFIVYLTCNILKLTLSLRNQYLAFAVEYLYTFKSYSAHRNHTTIVEWPLLRDMAQKYPRRVLYTSLKAEEIHLLPNGRLAVFTTDSVSVYNVSSIPLGENSMLFDAHADESERPYLTLSSPCTLSCSGHSSLSPRIISLPFVSPDSVDFLVDELDAKLQSVTISSDDFGDPRLTAKKLIQLPSHQWCKHWTTRYSLGRRRGVLYRWDHKSAESSLILLEYDPEQGFEPDYVPVIKGIKSDIQEGKTDQDTSRQLSPLQWKFEELAFDVLFDEASGRVVVPMDQRLEVLDFALMYK
ncbi:hypothetical protein D9613_009449 [Agrocybe pediades]|uniref:Uncharacterized protein n=1 Tax=Agrocybe pediades TaxID=84607 RepID=A0A8H4R3A5_9AGAR|nr:hypothetical protein D9613_009449 [Agrocybe pediades]